MMDLILDPKTDSSVKNTTFSNVGTLPKVPLPDLQTTAKKFIEWCSPLLTPEELQQTREALDAFVASGGDAEKLQQALIKYDAQEDTYSWLDDFWPTRYLGRRVPVSINANFIFSFIERPHNQIERAARLIGGAVRYKRLLDQEAIPPSYSRSTPLCMVQNKYLFSSTRVPALEQDIAKSPYSDEAPGSSKARHILVVHCQQLYRLEVIDADDQPYPVKALEQALKNIQENTPNSTSESYAAGYLTTLPRSDWAGVRAELLELNTDNVACMETIEQALFCLCLDDANPTDLRETAEQLLCGNGGNRWFDKSVSLIVFADGAAGINCEHCGLDGTTVVEFVDFLYSEEVETALEQEAHITPNSTPSYEPINFVLNTNLQQHIDTARSGFNALAENTATTYLSFDDFGSTHIKSLKVSPDSFAQLAFQLAHHRTKGFIGATYESISTRHYERGRTEAMRVVTPGVVDFVEAMENPEIDSNTKRAAFYEAAKQHIGRIKECQAGKAPEQHLWQLQILAQKQGSELGTAEDFELFQSPGWLKMRNDYLSTSSAPSDSITVFGFGATSEQCIGVAYLVRKDSIKAFLSTPTPVAEKMHQYAEKLATSFRDIASLLKED